MKSELPQLDYEARADDRPRVPRWLLVIAVACATAGIGYFIGHKWDLSELIVPSLENSLRERRNDPPAP